MSRKKSDLRLAPGRVERRRLGAQALEHLARAPPARRSPTLGEALALDLAAAGLLEIVELLEELLEPEGALERGEELVELAARGRRRRCSARRNSVKRPSTRASSLATRAAVP